MNDLFLRRASPNGSLQTDGWTEGGSGDEEVERTAVSRRMKSA